MKVTVMIPIKCYGTLLKELDTSSCEYRTLRSSVITHDEYGEAVATQCELEQAE